MVFAINHRCLNNDGVLIGIGRYGSYPCVPGGSGYESGGFADEGEDRTLYVLRVGSERGDESSPSSSSSSSSSENEAGAFAAGRNQIVQAAFLH